MIRFELHFGLAVRRICCLPRAALKDWIVNHCAIEAYQLIDTGGYWNGKQEDSLVLAAIVPESEERDTKALLKALAYEYRIDFTQDAVLLCWSQTNCTMVQSIDESPIWKGNPDDSE